jgi:site-specific recombinase XerD
MRPKEFFVMGEFTPGQIPANTFSLVAQSYFVWSEAEQQVSPETLIKRRDCLRQVARIIGEKPITAVDKSDLLRLKADLVRRNLSASRQYGILSALKYFLRYCEKEERLKVFPSEEVTFP